MKHLQPKFMTSLLLTFLALSHAAPARQITVEFDTAKTKIDFVLNDFLHTVHGSFQLTEGRVAFDSDTGSVSGAIIVDAASGKSGNGTRDRRMNRDILENTQYPEIRFSPEAINGNISTAGASSANVTGSFAIHGASHKVTIPMVVKISGADITATGKFVVPYVAWGMKNPSTFILRVSDTVTIDFLAIGRVQ